MLVGSTVPALVAVLPLTMGPAWYLSADENQPYLTAGTATWMLTVSAIALAPFIAVAVSLLSIRAVGQGWAKACRVAAAWAFGFGFLASVTAMFYGGGL